MRTLHLASPFMEGEDVRELQTLLNGSNVFGKDWFPGEVDGSFGVITAAAVKHAKWAIGFSQRDCIPACGENFLLYLRGKKKPTITMRRRAKTRARMEARRETATEKVVRIAHGELGVKESPANSNDGPRVRVYQNITKAFHAPWCASFCCWLLRAVGYRRKLPYLPAWCQGWVNAADSHFEGMRRVPAKVARPGDYVIYDWNNDSLADHIGLLISKVEDDKFTAIEGNTSFGNNSNGGQVMERHRTTADVRTFIRVVY